MNTLTLAAAGPISDGGRWSLGTLIGVPILALLTLATLAFIVTCAVGIARTPKDKVTHYDEWDRSDFKWGTFWGSVALVALVLIAGFGFFPYDRDYHQWHDVHGEVTAVSSRLIGADKTVSQRFVVQIQGQAFGVDDTRASLLKVGDTADLRCKKEYQWAGVSGWACEWGQA